MFAEDVLSYAFKDSLGRIAQVWGRPSATGKPEGGSDVIQMPAELAQTLSQLPDAATLHSPSGNVAWMSPLALELFGVPAGRFLDQGVETFVSPDDRADFLRVFGEVHTTGKRQTIVFRTPGRGGSPKGAPQWIETTLSPFNHQRLCEPALLAISRNVNDRFEYKADAEEWQKKAGRPDREKNNALSAIAHELGTPLNAIAGFSQVLQGTGGICVEPEKHGEYLDLINRSVSHVLEVLDRIRQETMLNAGHHKLQRQPVNVEDVVETAMTMVRSAAAGKSVGLMCDIEPELPRLNADPAAMRQILINLLSNAIKFTPADGWVKLKVSRNARWLVVQVSDNGIGMNDQAVEMLGQRYFRAGQQVAGEVAGTGLGLSIVYNLVELHDGKVMVASEEGQGSSFTIELPLEKTGTSPVPADPDSGVVYLKDVKPAAAPERLSMSRRTG